MGTDTGEDKPIEQKQQHNPSLRRKLATLLDVDVDSLEVTELADSRVNLRKKIAKSLNVPEDSQVVDAFLASSDTLVAITPSTTPPAAFNQVVDLAFKGFVLTIVASAIANITFATSAIFTHGIAVSDASSIFGITLNYSDTLLAGVLATDQIKNNKKPEKYITPTGALLLFGITTANVLASPKVHIIANAFASTGLGIGLGGLFVTWMVTCAAIEIKHVRYGNAAIKALEAEISDKLQTYHDPHNNSSALEKAKLREEINLMHNLIHFHKAQVADHKKHAWLWGASACTVAGSTIFATLAVMGIISLGAVTMGAVPAAIALVALGFAIARWYAVKHKPDLKNLPKQLDDHPMDLEQLNREKKRVSNIFGFFKRPSGLELEITLLEEKGGLYPAEFCLLQFYKDVVLALEEHNSNPDVSEANLIAACHAHLTRRFVQDTCREHIQKVVRFLFDKKWANRMSTHFWEQMMKQLDYPCAKLILNDKNLLKKLNPDILKSGVATISNQNERAEYRALLDKERPGIYGAAELTYEKCRGSFGNADYTVEFPDIDQLLQEIAEEIKNRRADHVPTRSQLYLDHLLQLHNKHLQKEFRASRREYAGPPERKLPHDEKSINSLKKSKEIIKKCTDFLKNLLEREGARCMPHEFWLMMIKARIEYATVILANNEIITMMKETPNSGEVSYLEQIAAFDSPHQAKLLLDQYSGHFTQEHITYCLNRVALSPAAHHQDLIDVEAAEAERNEEWRKHQKEGGRRQQEDEKLIAGNSPSFGKGGSTA